MTSIDVTSLDDQPETDTNFQELALAPKMSLEEEIIARASVNHEPMPMLDVIFGRVSTGFGTMLKSQNGFISESSPHELTYLPWAEAIAGLDPNGASAIAQSTWGGTIALAMDSALLHAVMIKLLGGKPSSADISRRPPTTLEKAFAQRVMKQALVDLSEHVSRITEVTFAMDSVESPTQMSSFMAAGAMSAVCSFEVEVGPIIGRMTYILPMQTLEPAREALSKIFLGERVGADHSWRDHFSDQISSANMTIAVELHRLSQPLADILNWRPGVTIDLGVTTDKEATVICSDHAILHGVTGRRRNGRMALRITREAGEVVKDKDDDDLIAD